MFQKMILKLRMHVMDDLNILKDIKIDNLLLVFKISLSSYQYFPYYKQ